MVPIARQPGPLLPTGASEPAATRSRVGFGVGARKRTLAAISLLALLLVLGTGTVLAVLTHHSSPPGAHRPFASWRREERHLVDEPSARQGWCTKAPRSEGSFPVSGVLYAPHIYGEPYPRPEADPEDIYDSTFSSLHRSGIPLIAHQLQADTLLLRPWSLGHGGPRKLLSLMSQHGLCKVIPTFHVSKYYAELLKQNRLQPDTSSDAALFKDFVRFCGTLVSNHTSGVQVVGWTVDLSLDLEQLLALPMDGDSCTPEPVQDKNYRRYKDFMEVLVSWVRQSGKLGAAMPALDNVPLLLPLDLSRIPYALPDVEDRLSSFLQCFVTWSPILFRPVEGSPRTKWLFSFALPHRGADGFNFKRWLRITSGMAAAQDIGVIVMLGTQALTADPNNLNNLVEDYGNETHAPMQQYRLRGAFAEYRGQASKPNSTLEGFIIDEWQDDWDRGARGPFYLAEGTMEKLRGACYHGGRFSHDSMRCARKVGNGYVYPEFFGLAETHSQALQHCLGPRFRNGTLFAFPRGHGGVGSNGVISVPGKLEKMPIQCAFVRPSIGWVVCAGVLCAVILVMHFCGDACTSCHREVVELPPTENEEDVRTRTHGHAIITSMEPRLCGDHSIELSSNNFRHNNEVGFWLWSHQGAQMSILECQVMAEVATRQALRSRKSQQFQPSQFLQERTGSDMDGSEAQLSLDASNDDLAAAMATIHRRALEGFSAWCRYVGSSSRGMPAGVERSQLQELEYLVYDNATRSPARLFAETLVLRTMESLSEQIMHCPERLCHLFFDVLLKAGHLNEDERPTVYSIDFEELHAGLSQMNEHSNPYERAPLKTPSNAKRMMRGINFDDINECGIQCREVTKTYKEPASLLVLIDFLLCYRAPFMIKLWGLFIAGYIYLGSGLSDDITTAHNGDWYKPKWLRINFIQYTALCDASVWCFLETLLILYVAWQRWPSLGHRSPGIPGCFWFVEHLADLAASAAGAWYVFTNSDFRRKPPECRELDSEMCDDPRSSLSFLWRTCLYWLCRVLIFGALHRMRKPVLLYGTPWRDTRRDAGRTLASDVWNDTIVNLTWFVMLLLCVVLEVFLLLPAMKGLSWDSACGFNLVGSVLGVPEETGVCSLTDHWAGCQCVSCIVSISLAGLLVWLCSLVDIYFVFYVFASFSGMMMGHNRHLNDLKNTSVLVDLRPQEGREAKRFETTFGPGWRQVWLLMVQSLFEDAYISPSDFVTLVEAAGLTPAAEEVIENRSKKMKPIHLDRYPRLAAERLAFFFRSLKWIEEPNWPVRDMRFQSSSDAITGENFNPGTVPSLTQIIPVYNETILPSAMFLRAGSLPEDAMNQNPEGFSGVGDMTAPPIGSGVCTNLAFMISQFPDEWTYLTKRLHLEGKLTDPGAHNLYEDFMRHRLTAELSLEVRLWAASRSQTVAKTVIGALQYGRALASLPAFRKLYKMQPNKRVPEDHSEVILAHQTFGQNPPHGNTENDEAVQLLMMRYDDAPLFLVFDLTPSSSERTWDMVKTFLFHQGGYDGQGFQYAGVKCRWDSQTQGLKVLEVLPRKFPLRLGKGDYKTQGKAGNQLNGLRFARGHYLQALDCNMGAFIGEGFKLPYVLRVFMPLDKSDRVATRCRFLGFREYIYTERDGTVGRCHAAAEWTFGTIFQRFLSALGTRMHYGHPDFLDGFWARNRGGMSKGSAVVNLSEDLFAGYNVRMREEASPHIDSLEFEKGREASFNAASNFFAKISGGSIAVLRSRDNHLLCERIGVVHSLSFYFTSVAFYVSNFIVDVSTYLYVWIFAYFTLANMHLDRLSLLGSSFATEWMISLGIVSIVPQLFEMVLEYGASHAVKSVTGGFFAATGFYIFQNKNISSSMRTGAATGVARYLSTGRPMANQHLTWKDIYVTYSKSHFQPAFTLLTAWCLYHLLVAHTFQGQLPMMLIVITFTAWFIMPILFNPFPRWTIIKEDLRDFNGFINGRAGMEEEDLDEVISRGKTGQVRTLFEFGLADEISTWSDQPGLVLCLYILVRIAVSLIIIFSVPSGITDFLWIYVVVLSMQWVIVLGFFMFDLSNVLLSLSVIILPFVLWAGRWIVGHRAARPSVVTRLPEYCISCLFFQYLLGLIKQFILLFSGSVYSFNSWRNPRSEPAARKQHQLLVRTTYVFFFVHQYHFVQAYIVMVFNTIVSLLMALVDVLPFHLHTRWLLNAQMASASNKEKYLDKLPGFLKLDERRTTGYNSDSSDEASETSSLNSMNANFLRHRK